MAEINHVHHHRNGTSTSHPMDDLGKSFGGWKIYTCIDCGVDVYTDDPATIEEPPEEEQ